MANVKMLNLPVCRSARVSFCEFMAGRSALKIKKSRIRASSVILKVCFGY